MPPDAPGTRERILEVAAELFREKGYDGTSLREIADRMGFSKAALYYHFRSKEEILLAILTPLFEATAGLQERMAAARTMEDWAATFEWWIDVLFEHLPAFALMDRNLASIDALAEASEFFTDHQGWHDRIEEAIAAHGRSLEDRVRITCAFGALAGFDDFGHNLVRENPVGAREHLVATIRSMLGLPKARRGATSRSG
jgi:AcrR family transcriptional regulator